MRVFVDEEYGYRWWLWETEMTPQELRSFWGAQVSMPGSPSQAWPGTWRALSDTFDAPEVPFTVVDEEGRRYVLADLQAGPHAHVHMDDDSYLVIDNEEILHAGFAETDQG